jgi:GT2 family glycosyltransferase
MRPQERNISIIIVNWNAGIQLVEVVKSIAKYHQGLVAKVVLVDNASTDNSLNLVRHLKQLPFRMEIIENSVNLGFGAACNQGAAKSIGEYLLFLNPDTLLFKDSLIYPLIFMEDLTNADIGICGIRLVDINGHSSTSAARFPTLRVMSGNILGLAKLFPNIFPPHLLTSDDLNESGFVDQVIGAFFLIRKNVYDLCEGFDEQFFVYFEEVDLAFRAKQLGYSSYFVSEASAFHKGGGCSDQVKAIRLFYSLSSRILYAQKHYSIFDFVMLLLLTLLELPLRLVQALIRGSWIDIKNSISAYIRLMKFFLRRP